MRLSAALPGLAVAVAALVCAPVMLAATPAAAPTRSADLAAVTAPAFRWSIRPIDAALAERMRFSWRAGCPVPLSQLRYVTVSYVGFAGRFRTGELVVRYGQGTNIVSVFRTLYRQEFPIQGMRLVDDYRGSDGASMRANNTSAFNCRKTTSGRAWSQHSYGRALDINPVQNPYVSGRVVEPASGAAYVDRSPLRKGMVTTGVRRAFTDISWKWGGGWSSLKDYMHFSANGL